MPPKDVPRNPILWYRVLRPPWAKATQHGCKWFESQVGPNPKSFAGVRKGDYVAIKQTKTKTDKDAVLAIVQVQGTEHAAGATALEVQPALAEASFAPYFQNCPAGVPGVPSKPELLTELQAFFDTGARVAYFTFDKIWDVSGLELKPDILWAMFSEGPPRTAGIPTQNLSKVCDDLSAQRLDTLQELLGYASNRYTFQPRAEAGPAPSSQAGAPEPSRPRSAPPMKFPKRAKLEPAGPVMLGAAPPAVAPVPPARLFNKPLAGQRSAMDLEPDSPVPPAHIFKKKMAKHQTMDLELDTDAEAASDGGCKCK